MSAGTGSSREGPEEIRGPECEAVEGGGGERWPVMGRESRGS